MTGLGIPGRFTVLPHKHLAHRVEVRYEVNGPGISPMTFDVLKQFLVKKMRLSHAYQRVIRVG